MKRFFLAAAVLLLAGVAVIFYSRPNRTKEKETGPPTAKRAFPPIAAAANSNSNSPSQESSAAAREQTNLASQAGQYVANAGVSVPSNLPPEIVLQNVRRVIHQYGQMFGGNPVGTNPEITAALAGKNPKQINFLNDQPGVHIDQNGEMIDAWGTPYFFHQLSGTVMEIHSAGPDKIMWTSDDLVTQ